MFVVGSLSGPASYEAELSKTRKAETTRRVAGEKRDLLLNEIVALELKMGISRRWQPADPEYVEANRYTNERKYHRALDNLQRLVIQRLFELNKLNIAATGMYTSIIEVPY